MKNIREVASQIINDNNNIQLIYAFNSVGKTRLSISYNELKKNDDGTHAGIYYNAYSEDLFSWYNDIENDGTEIRLNIRHSRLSLLHNNFSEPDIEQKLKPYRPRFKFRFNMHEDLEMGIESISFFPNSSVPGDVSAIKISRGEERIFIWCFFLVIMDLKGWTNYQYFFIDDPVSSLDDHKIFITASILYELIEENYNNLKIIITTHHVGLYSILFDWLLKGEKKDRYAKEVKASILSKKQDIVSLETHRGDVFLYHLRVLQLLEKAISTNSVRVYHFALLRQILENVSSFLGAGQMSYVLSYIGYADKDKDEISQLVNVLTHKNSFRYESEYLVQDNLVMFEDIYQKLNDHFKFITHKS